MNNIRLREFLIIIFLLAYLVVLLKLLVFKYPGVYFDPDYNFVPLKTILPYLMGYPTWIVARNNLLGNIILFFPLGIFLPFLYRQTNWKNALVVGFAFSLGFEVLQIVLHKGTFDVDDIILNTLGALLGYCLLKQTWKLISTKTTLA